MVLMLIFKIVMAETSLFYVYNIENEENRNKTILLLLEKGANPTIKDKVNLF